ncbi:putative PLAC8 motif-containing protein [Helianthus annuus]|uniref:PLAC8 motif-containing protein n=1 Tax=Helianthus annuus TaxID=4232 RepID=A0A251RU70_HELAN|nr:cell number regulator 7 [Helianthus annuus]KAF5757429.1 putative PLAC8 motif-containing protein [Helianthus annuus]KAJ0449245.1 putative PLAC8 motif-containing protein [Helianthus annuus]KAJ0634103.1 putative PLAC8 motif-containing protein [Helianthus annuus]KAJ0669379.1 putative PLAC8 motif-containing protein [Helianthus annuus]KAJ0815084.1 putative PLAC8 motif-containing protein [Helianthus annuus]
MTTSGEWSTGLCDCGKDCSSCCLTWWCPCISFGRIAEIVDKGTTSCCASGSVYFLLTVFTGFECLYSCMYRTKLRNQYSLPKQPCNDCLVHFFCKPCALCQEYRELKYRGLNPSYGWQENMSKQSQGVVMPPVGPGEMKR